MDLNKTRLVLFVEGKREATTRVFLKQDSLFKTKLNLAIGLMKIEKGWMIMGKDYEIFLQIKSKANER